jgi:hypothetical protein
MITEINRLDIGFKNLIEKLFIEQQTRTEAIFLVMCDPSVNEL